MPTPSVTFVPATEDHLPRFEEIRAAAFAPVFASFRALLGDTVYEVAQAPEDRAQPERLDVPPTVSGWSAERAPEPGSRPIFPRGIPGGLHGAEVRVSAGFRQSHCHPERPRRPRYDAVVTDAARKLLDEALRLPEDDRAKLASELLASLDGEPDADWEQSWLTELDRRVEAAERRGETGSDWRSARQRILARLGTR